MFLKNFMDLSISIRQQILTVPTKFKHSYPVHFPSSVKRLAQPNLQPLNFFFVCIYKSNCIVVYKNGQLILNSNYDILNSNSSPNTSYIIKSNATYHEKLS